MLRQLFSMLLQDDNPRLHRIPFLLLWIASYGLIWVTIFVFINQVSCWSSGENSIPDMRDINIFVGFVIALTLFPIQRWLLQQRYGYMPKYLGIATLIGGFISGFGYPKLATGIMHPRITIDDMIIWFGAITLFQTLATLHTNRRSWLIALVGIGAASVIITNLHFNLAYSRAVFVLATAIQAIGTGLAMLNLMGNPRQGIVPKRKSSEKPKHQDEKLSPFTFVIIWMVVFYIAYAGAILVGEMLDTFLHIPPFDQIWRQRENVLPLIFGIVLSISQKWLIEKYLGQTIRFWGWFTIIGWVVVCLVTTMTDDRIALFLTWLIIPIVAQMIAIRSLMSFSWIWVFAGVVTLFVSFIFLEIGRFNFQSPRTWFYAVTIMSFTTALALLSITSLNKKTITSTTTL
jgi:hypothetical protein